MESQTPSIVIGVDVYLDPELDELGKSETSPSPLEHESCHNQAVIRVTRLPASSPILDLNQQAPGTAQMREPRSEALALQWLALGEQLLQSQGPANAPHQIDEVEATCANTTE
jgi:hypothetical protein